MKIPCDVIARLSHVLPLSGADVDEPYRCIRLDNGKVITTDRCFMAIEEVEPFDGVFYIRPEPTLIGQCEIESQWSSVIDFTPVPSVRWTTAITTMGWKQSDNIGYWPDTATDYDKWFERVALPCIEPLTASGAPLSVDAEGLRKLVRSSPSGRVVFAGHFDPMRATVVRDVDSPHWCGFFIPQVDASRHFQPATVPGWVK